MPFDTLSIKILNPSQHRGKKIKDTPKSQKVIELHFQKKPEVNQRNILLI